MSKKDELEKETKTCGACHKDLTITSYSKKQWQLKLQRRCKECIELDNAIKEMDMNDKQSTNKSKKKGGLRATKAKISIPSPYSIASGISTTTERTAGSQLALPPQPSIEQIREIKKSLSDPNHLVELFCNTKNSEMVFASNPEYARAVANNPLLQNAPDMREEDILKMAEMMKNMDEEQFLKMVSDERLDLPVAQDKKVTMKAAKKLTDEAACWVCLDDGCDDEGNPLVRDCSCRGNSGFAHLSCLKKYAKSKGMELNDASFHDNWSRCPHCLQEYQGDLAVAMSDACLLYFDNAHIMFKPVEHTEKGTGQEIVNNMIRSIIMISKFTALQSLAMTNPKRVKEACQAGEDIILVFDRNRELYEKDSYVQGRNVNVSTSMEIDTCQHLARLYSAIRSPENDKNVIKYGERALRVCKEAGKLEQAKQVENILETQKAKFRRKHAGIRGEEEYAQIEATVLPEARVSYKISQGEGWSSADELFRGKNLSHVLLQSGHGIECQRLMNKLVEKSRLVFGPDHPETLSLSSFYDEAIRRNVLIENLFDKNARPFQMIVVGYANESGDQYVLAGATKKDPPSETVDCDIEMLWFQPGTPVVCKGLVSAPHLNGKIGDIRRRHKKTNRYAVHFADQSLEPKSILARNLRVLIDVPDENEINDDSYIIVKK